MCLAFDVAPIAIIRCTDGPYLNETMAGCLVHHKMDQQKICKTFTTALLERAAETEYSNGKLIWWKSIHFFPSPFEIVKCRSFT